MRWRRTSVLASVGPYTVRSSHTPCPELSLPIPYTPVDVEPEEAAAAETTVADRVLGREPAKKKEVG